MVTRVTAELLNKTNVQAQEYGRSIALVEPINYLATIDGQTTLVIEIPKTRLANIFYVARTKLLAALEAPGKVFRNIIEDVSNLAELVQKYFQKSADTDFVETSEYLENVLYKYPTDNVFLVETVSVFFERNRILESFTTIGTTHNYSITKVVDTDITSISDNIFIQSAYHRDFYDVVTLTDDINGAAVGDDQTAIFFKIKQDYGYLLDNRVTSVGKNIADSASIATSSGKLLSQSYAQQYYFAEDYTGTSRTFN